MSKTFSVKTLGCKLNQYDSGRISGALKRCGWIELPFGEKCDAVIVNTCTVTDNSDKKCRNYIRRAAQAGDVFVTGCLASRDGESVLSIPGVKAVYSNDDKENLILDLEPSASGESFFSLFGRTRSFLKIQDGCDGKCSYCIVPSVRGVPRSRSASEIIDEAKILIDNKTPEIVLTGITIGKYNDDGLDLASLASKIASLNGDFRIRITSIEPLHLTDALAEIYSHEKIAPHIHLPLQSGSAKVLSEMNRPYTPRQFIESVERIKRVNDDIAVGTDIMVGYPSEKSEDFDETLKIANEAQFSYIHQFTYSPRAGTVSACMKMEEKNIISERAAKLKKLGGSLMKNYRERFVGKLLSSVIEDDEALSGNYIHMKISDKIDKKTAHVRLLDSGANPRGEII
ncbi:MAG TPA: MiaB/RimO family radical SAM methylthiotransferase [Spirochaetota bacterium]|nr:MiaB/RimO family radical SAM methylthiotransferase [Spirochaetota bacterium]HOR44473.1 MiaB/RimO family radical SAM methylthiotransferase [Spirochaetota bacterium]HPK56060.1 MiaB/RimO family radical SAM methylthiotransferase [Spirochaetota bacterium]